MSVVKKIGKDAIRIITRSCHASTVHRLGSCTSQNRKSTETEADQVPGCPSSQVSFFKYTIHHTIDRTIRPKGAEYALSHKACARSGSYYAFSSRSQSATPFACSAVVSNVGTVMFSGVKTSLNSVQPKIMHSTSFSRTSC